MTYSEFLTHAPPIEVLDRLIAAGFGNRRPQTTITQAEFEVAMSMASVDLRGVLSEEPVPHCQGYEYPRECRTPQRHWPKPRRRQEMEEIWPSECLRITGRARRMILRAE